MFLSSSGADFIEHSLDSHNGIWINLVWTFSWEEGASSAIRATDAGLPLPSVCDKPIMEIHMDRKHYKILHLPRIVHFQPAHNYHKTAPALKMYHLCKSRKDFPMS
jgi:hypothetical protein